MTGVVGSTPDRTKFSLRAQAHVTTPPTHSCTHACGYGQVNHGCRHGFLATVTRRTVRPKARSGTGPAPGDLPTCCPDLPTASVSPAAADPPAVRRPSARRPDAPSAAPHRPSGPGRRRV